MSRVIVKPNSIDKDFATRRYEGGLWRSLGILSVRKPPDRHQRIHHAVFWYDYDRGVKSERFKEDCQGVGLNAILIKSTVLNRTTYQLGKVIETLHVGMISF